MRYVIGDLTIRLCSGIFHRIETIKQAAANYDYNPYLITKSGIFILFDLYIYMIIIFIILYIYMNRSYLYNHIYKLSDPLVNELPPVTLEEYEALRENVSMVETKLLIVKASLQLQLADHSITGLPRQRKIVESRVSNIYRYIMNNIYWNIIYSFFLTLLF